MASRGCWSSSKCASRLSQPHFLPNNLTDPIVCTDETLEDSRQDFRGYPGAVIKDTDHRMGIFDVKGNLYGAAIEIVLDGVGQEFGHDLLDF